MSWKKSSSLLEFSKANLNSNGLLSTAASAEAFLREYQAQLDAGHDYETLDVVIPIELWHDPELKALK